MTTPRRRIVRTAPSVPAPDPRRQERLRRLRDRLAADRVALARWMTRLRRAFHRVELLQRSAARVEREINKLEGP
jgi:hypothetical protein